MKKVMVIAGGDWQIELIKKIKSMGHYVICTNLYENSPAFPYADVCEVANVLDKEKNLEIAKKYMPNAVVSDQSDISVPTVAYLNEQLGLKGIGVDKANIFTDKVLMRQHCKKNGLPVPDFRVCRTIIDAQEMLRKYEKIIIKPIDSQSSRGVYTITNSDELEKRFNETITYSNRRKEILAEEYLDGDEFTIDGLVVNRTHYPLCISIKEMYKKNPNVSKIQIYTHSHFKYDYGELRKVNKSLIENIGLSFGLTHSEYKFCKGKFYLIEAGARGGGSNLSAKIVPYMSGVDNYEYFIHQALGEKVDESPLKKLRFKDERCVMMHFFDFGKGIVKSVHGKTYLEKCQGLIDYQFKIMPGDKLESPKYGRQRPGHFIIGRANYEEAQKAVEDIIKHVYVTFEE